MMRGYVEAHLLTVARVLVVIFVAGEAIQEIVLDICWDPCPSGEYKPVV